MSDEGASAMAAYRYALLLPAGAREANDHNAEILREDTLGVEATEPALAAACRLGNIDPQHEGSGSSQAAIEAAATWHLPPHGAMLATIRPDLDALGAMAVLTLRAENGVLSPVMTARIAEVARADRFDRGPWPGPRPWPSSAVDLIEELGGADIGVLTAAMRDGARSVDERVRIARDWLVSGSVPPVYRGAPAARAERLWQAFRDGRVTVDQSRAPGRLVEIVSEADGAVQLGYRAAPVVVALNPRFDFRDGAVGPKFTIAQYRAGYADLDEALAMLAGLEHGWGGTPTIKGSPQGHPTRLDRATVAEVAMRSLKTTEP